LQVQKHALTQKRAVPAGAPGQPHIGSAAGHRFVSVQLRWQVHTPGPGPPHAHVNPVGQSFRSRVHASGPSAPPSRRPPLPPALVPPALVPPALVPAAPAAPPVPPLWLPAAPAVPPSPVDVTDPHDCAVAAAPSATIASSAILRLKSGLIP